MSFQRMRRAMIAACVSSLLTLAAAPASAQGVYSVGGVAVDASAETAALAREAAIAEGQSRALGLLFRRLVLASDVKRLPSLAPAQVTDLVQGFSVANERSTTGRYLADFTVRFRAESVRALFLQYRVRFAETQSRPLLVLPVLGPRGEAVLWEEPNPWRLAWARAAGRGGLIPIEVPIGDLSDMNAVGAEQALAGDLDRLRALADRHGTTDLLIAQARLDGDPDSGTAALRVESRRGTATGLGAGPSGSYQQQGGEDLAALLARAVEGTIVPLESAWKQQNALDFSTRSQLLVQVRFRDLGEFAETQRRLAQVPAILGKSVSRLKRDRADMMLTVVGGLNQLGTALAQKQLILERPEVGTGAAASGGGFGAPAQAQWSLRLGSGAVPTAVPTATPAPAGGVGILGGDGAGVSFEDLARQAKPGEEGSVERIDDGGAGDGASGGSSAAE